MARDEAKVGRWRRWRPIARSRSTGPTSAKKWVGTAVVSAMLAAALGAFVWLCFVLFFKPGPQPYFLAFWVGPYDRPEIPATAWLDADRKALKDDKVFSKADPRPEDAGKLTSRSCRNRSRTSPAAGPTRTWSCTCRPMRSSMPRRRSRSWRPTPPRTRAKTQLALSWVLDRLKDCPAKNKLLVLDIMRGMIDPRDVGGTADGVGDLLALELHDAADPNRLNDPDLMVIAACGPGQAALGSESLRHSVFGYYFHRALTTDEADSNSDRRGLGPRAGRLPDQERRCLVHALPRASSEAGAPGPPAGRLRAGPDAAGRDRRGQAAAKAKSDEKDKAAVAAKIKESAGDEKDKAKAKEKEPAADAVAGASSGEPASDYPPWLAEAWTTVERWRTAGDFQAAPRVYRRLAREAIRAELRWRGGEPDETVRPDLDKTVAELTAAMKQAQDVRRPPFRSVGQARDFGRAAGPRADEGCWPGCSTCTATRPTTRQSGPRRSRRPWRRSRARRGSTWPSPWSTPRRTRPSTPGCSSSSTRSSTSRGRSSTRRSRPARFSS